MSKQIVLLPGDGIGKEIMEAAKVVLRAISNEYGHRFTFHEHAIGGLPLGGSAVDGDRPAGMRAFPEDQHATVRGVDIDGTAIVVQGAVASVIALSGSYERILGYVVAIDWLFFGLTALALVVFRRRDAKPETDNGSFRVPGHPLTTLMFVLGAWLMVVNTVYRFPADALAGVALLAAGVPVYFLWQRRRGTTT